MMANNLHVMNDGRKPTLIRHNGVSYIEISMISEEHVTRGTDWEVIDSEDSLSDHQYIDFG